MSTSGKRGSKILGVISRGKAERLLVDWANLPLDWATDQGQLPLDRVLAARKRMLALYPDVFEGLDDRQLIVVLCEVQRFLRKAWDSSDVRHRNWYLTTMPNSFHELAFVYKTPDEEHWTYGSSSWMVSRARRGLDLCMERRVTRFWPAWIPNLRDTE